jgi:hypothetical protein
MRPTLAVLLLSTAVLGGCAAPYAIPPYASDATLSGKLTALDARGIAIGSITEVPFDSSCRGLQRLALPEGLSPGTYLHKTLELELGKAAALAGQVQRVTLNGRLTRIEASSTTAITMGTWHLHLELRSSNGSVSQATASHEFDSGFAYQEACRNTAQAFPVAVQKLIGAALASPSFPALIR